MRQHADWPEREVLRLEGFIDELLHTLRAAPVFAVCFARASPGWGTF